MPLSDIEQMAAVERQLLDWTAEMKRLAAQIAATKGTSCAVVMIYGPDEDYEDVAPELILEDALRVNPHGWPDGFQFDVLNREN